jgi:hypothetical protein
MSNVLAEDDDINDDDIIIVDDSTDNADDDARLGNTDETTSERDAIRERRRLEKQDRKARRGKAIDRDKLELDFLRNRNDDLERRVSSQEQRAFQGDLNNLDQELTRTSQEAEMADRVIAKAIESGNGEDVTKAMRYRDQAIAKYNHLSQVKQQAQAPAQQPRNTVDSATMSHANEFMEDHSWYDPTGADEDSSIVLAIDQALSKDGFDPKTEDYWDELRDRVAKRLPEHFGKKNRVARGGPNVGSSREHVPSSTRKEIYINPERKQALIEAGVWDDPVLRLKYVKRYAEYDKKNKD